RPDRRRAAFIHQDVTGRAIASGAEVEGDRAGTERLIAAILADPMPGDRGQGNGISADRYQSGMVRGTARDDDSQSGRGGDDQPPPMSFDDAPRDRQSESRPPLSCPD